MKDPKFIHWTAQRAVIPARDRAVALETGIVLLEAVKDIDCLK